MTALRLVRDEDEEAIERDTRKKMDLGTVYAFADVITLGNTTFTYILKSGTVLSIHIPSDIAHDESINEAVWDLAWAADALCKPKMERVQ